MKEYLQEVHSMKCKVKYTFQVHCQLHNQVHSEAQRAADEYRQMLQQTKGAVQAVQRSRLWC
jgi:hypothetical protein